MYTLTFADGHKVEGLRGEGNIFSKEGKIPRGEVCGELGHCVVEQTAPADEDTYPLMFAPGEHEAVRGVWYEVLNGRTSFILEDVPAGELGILRAEANIEYVAMMTGVEL